MSVDSLHPGFCYGGLVGEMWSQFIRYIMASGVKVVWWDLFSGGSVHGVVCDVRLNGTVGFPLLQDVASDLLV